MAPTKFVVQTPDGPIFPSNIPHKRGINGQVAILLTFAFSIAASWLAYRREQNGWLYFGMFTSFSILLNGLLEIILRMNMFFEECLHLSSRYKNSYINLLCDLFYFTTFNYLCILISTVFLFVACLIIGGNPLAVLADEIILFSLLFLGTNMLNAVLPFNISPVRTSYALEESNGLDYGSGMAYSFFYGYLNIILKSNGVEYDKSLKDFLVDFEDGHNVKFAAYKLFVLIPFSGYCPSRLDNDFSKSISESEGLESKRVNRAGVPRRNYKNCVYKIANQSGKLHYVSAEYATPIKTLQEAMERNGLYKRHHQDLIYNFYKTLVDLVEDDPDCRDVCDIIYYNDVDKNGTRYDVGRIILDRLRQL